MTEASPKKTPPAGKPDARKARLAGELRANLMKRKAQMRARAAADADAPIAPEGGDGGERA